MMKSITLKLLCQLLVIQFFTSHFILEFNLISLWSLFVGCPHEHGARDMGISFVFCLVW